MNAKEIFEFSFPSEEKERKMMREATTTTTQTTTSNALKGGGFDADGFDEEDNKKNASFFRSYKSLLSRWPARKKHIDFLLAALGGGFGCDAKTCLAPNVHVHGPPSVGKTMLLRDMFDLLEKKFGFAHAYVNCVDAHDKKLMF